MKKIDATKRFSLCSFANARMSSTAAVIASGAAALVATGAAVYLNKFYYSGWLI